MKIGTAALQDKIKEVLESPIVTTKQRGEPSTKRGGSGHRIYVSQDTRPRTGDKPVTLDGKYNLLGSNRSEIEVNYVISF
jgi:hypothetical protein